MAKANFRLSAPCFLDIFPLRLTSKAGKSSSSESEIHGARWSGTDGGATGESLLCSQAGLCRPVRDWLVLELPVSSLQALLRIPMLNLSLGKQLSG